MSAGYSGTPLARKLGITSGKLHAFLNAPNDYLSILGGLPADVAVTSELKGEMDFIQLFATDSLRLKRELPGLKAVMKQDGILWVSWPKKSSKIKTDLTDGVVREIGLRNGLVDVKVCAVDESWSALKFVRRLKDRHVQRQKAKTR